MTDKLSIGQSAPAGDLTPVVYHGSPRSFTDFNQQMGGQLSSGVGNNTDAIFFTDNPHIASGYTYNNGGLPGSNVPEGEGQVRMARLNLKNPYISNDGRFTKFIYKENIDALKAQGYDGIIENNGYGGKEYIVFDKSQIHSPWATSSSAGQALSGAKKSAANIAKETFAKAADTKLGGAVVSGVESRAGQTTLAVAGKVLPKALKFLKVAGPVGMVISFGADAENAGSPGENGAIMPDGNRLIINSKGQAQIVKIAGNKFNGYELQGTDEEGRLVYQDSQTKLIKRVQLTDPKHMNTNTETIQIKDGVAYILNAHNTISTKLSASGTTSSNMVNVDLSLSPNKMLASQVMKQQEVASGQKVEAFSGSGAGFGAFNNALAAGDISKHATPAPSQEHPRHTYSVGNVSSGLTSSSSDRPNPELVAQAAVAEHTTLPQMGPDQMLSGDLNPPTKPELMAPPAVFSPAAFATDKLAAEPSSTYQSAHDIPDPAAYATAKAAANEAAGLEPGPRAGQIAFQGLQPSPTNRFDPVAFASDKLATQSTTPLQMPPSGMTFPANINLPAGYAAATIKPTIFSPTSGGTADQIEAKIIAKNEAAAAGTSAGPTGATTNVPVPGGLPLTPPPLGKKEPEVVVPEVKPATQAPPQDSLVIQAQNLRTLAEASPKPAATTVIVSHPTPAAQTVLEHHANMDSPIPVKPKPAPAAAPPPAPAAALVTPPAHPNTPAIASPNTQRFGATDPVPGHMHRLDEDFSGGLTTFNVGPDIKSGHGGR